MSPELPHLRLPAPAPIPYRYPGFPRDERPLPGRDPQLHGERLLADLAGVATALRELSDVERPPEARGHLLKARIVPDTPANVSGLGDARADALVVARTDDGALVHLRRDRVAHLERKIRDYINPEKHTKAGARKNAPLVAPLEELRLATLHDLSAGWLSEDDLHEGRPYWVELWVAGGRLASDEDRAGTRRQLEWLLATYEAHANVSLRAFVATEHDIYLVPLHASALRRLPEIVPDVYRVGPPDRVQVPWLVGNQADLSLPSCEPPDDDETVVAVLDTGVAEQHPLLAPAIHATGRSIVVGELTTQDTHGHGTRMAGLVAYRDLAGQLATGRPVRPRTRLHGVRVMAGGRTVGDLEFWPDRTREAIEVAEQVRAARRVFNLSIGAVPEVPGDHTTWGMAVDALAHDGGRGRLICVSAGNVPPSSGTPPVYPDDNLSGGLAGPGDAVNAITIGAMTELVVTSPQYAPVAGDGELSPFSRCDVGGPRPIKPDVVLEGGNWATDGAGSYTEASLSLLTTDNGHAIGPPLSRTNATSAACAQGSGLVSEIWQANPTRRPETIRGLLVHSARWTDAMRQQFSDPRDLRRACGYGRPSAEVAAYSDRTRPTLILESQLRPERRLHEGREMHFIKLPLPDPALESLGNTLIEISVTLSFFAEPNENNLRRYQGAGLRWGLQRPSEDEHRFRQRINRLDRDDEYAGAVEDLPWEIGDQARRRGTVQSDRARVTAGELLGGRAVAVWSAGGWWRYRPDRADAVIPYALIVTLDAGDADLDLYTSIENELTILIDGQ